MEPEHDGGVHMVAHNFVRNNFLRKFTSFAKMESWQVAEEVILSLRKVKIRNKVR